MRTRASAACDAAQRFDRVVTRAVVDVDDFGAAGHCVEHWRERRLAGAHQVRAVEDGHDDGDERPLGHEAGAMRSDGSRPG